MWDLSSSACSSVCLCVQMTAQEVRLCSLLLQEHFGEVVAKVGTHLLKSGAQNLRIIIHETGVSLDLVPLLHSRLHFIPWKYYDTLCIQQHRYDYFTVIPAFLVTLVHSWVFLSVLLSIFTYTDYSTVAAVVQQQFLHHQYKCKTL